MTIEKARLINTCDKVILFSLYATAFLFPVSKAAIETFTTLAIVFFILKKVLERRGLPKTPIKPAILVFLAICFVSIFFSSNPRISARTFIGKTIQDIILFFVLVDALNNKRKLKTLLYIFFISAAVLGIDGIYQFFTHKDFLRHRPAIFVSRIYASFLTPNDFGCYLNAIMPFVVTVFFTGSRFKRTKFLLAGLFGLLFVCLLMTVSRGAWFSFMASALFLGLWIYPVGIFFLLLGLFIFATQPFYPPLIRQRMDSFFIYNPALLDDPGSIERKIIWEAGWKMFMSRPLIGLGLGTFMFNFKRFVDETYQYGPAYAHNCYLQMLSELGIIGLIAFLFILAVFFYKGIMALYKQKEKTFFWYILAASLAAVVGYAVQMGVDTIFYSLDLGMLFWILLGIGVAAMNNISLEAERASLNSG